MRYMPSLRLWKVKLLNVTKVYLYSQVRHFMLERTVFAQVRKTSSHSGIYEKSASPRKNCVE